MVKNYIILHNSLTKDGDTVSWGAIRKYHMQTNGWKEIGYHAGVEIINGHPEILLGRMPDEEGAHCKAAMMNKRGIGICVVGNFDLEAPRADVLGKTYQLVKWLMRIYPVTHGNVIGHKEAQEMDGVPVEQRKSCPGKLFPLHEFREALKDSEHQF